MADGGAESVFSPIVLGPEGGLVAKCQRKQRARAGFGAQAVTLLAIVYRGKVEQIPLAKNGEAGRDPQR
jgi:hypothetical protein